MWFREREREKASLTVEVISECAWLIVSVIE